MKLTKEFKRENLLRHSFLALALCSTLGVFSHTRNVNGRVVDQNGEPIIGASAVVKGTKLGVVTTPVRGNRVFYTILMQREYASSPYH